MKSNTECPMHLYESCKESDEESEKEITFDELIGKVLMVENGNLKGLMTKDF